MSDVYSYELSGKIYINLTNKCSNSCEFCVRNGKNAYYGHPLWLKKEPTAAEVIESIDFSKDYKEAVFCGFGEPTERMAELKEVARELKRRGLKTRINTNGQGNLINGRDITAELCENMDVVNVSLNAPDKKLYQAECHSIYGEAAFDELIKFAVMCKAEGSDVVLSVVDCIGKEAVIKCKEIADNNGLNLRVREMIKDS